MVMNISDGRLNRSTLKVRLLVVLLKVSLFCVEPYFFVFTLIVISQILVLINTKKKLPLYEK